MTARENENILARLRATKKKSPELVEVIDLHYDLIEAQAQVQVPSIQFNLDAERTKAHLGAGTPLLYTQAMEIDWETWSKLYKKVCEITAQHRPHLSDQIEGLLKLLQDRPDSAQNLALGYLKQGDMPDSDLEKDQKELLGFVFYHTLRPFLKAYADALAPLIEEDFWRKGPCPVCGGEPDLGLLDNETGARRLICSRCDTQWLFPRIKCPFCHTTEPSKLSYYAGEDETYRIYVCQDCRRYLKAIDLRKTQRQALFPVERITTVELDLTAREEGYR